MSRYKSRQVASNKDQLYQEVFEERGVKGIIQFTTPSFRRPTDELLSTINTKKYVWTVGDRYWRLAEKFYNDRNLWYIIARFNNKPTEGHLKPGDTIKIPTNAERALEVLR